MVYYRRYTKSISTRKGSLHFLIHTTYVLYCQYTVVVLVHLQRHKNRNPPLIWAHAKPIFSHRKKMMPKSSLEKYIVVYYLWMREKEETLHLCIVYRLFFSWPNSWPSEKIHTRIIVPYQYTKPFPSLSEKQFSKLSMQQSII